MVGPTADHGEIRRWADRYGAVPMEVPQVPDDEASLQLCLKVGGPEGDARGERIVSWDEFFRGFDALGLVFVGSENGSGFHELLQQVEDAAPYRVLSCLAASQYLSGIEKTAGGEARGRFH